MKTCTDDAHSVGEILRPVWAEVNLANISDNVRHIGSFLAGRPMMAIVKANAYGHGAVPVAQAALSAGATWLGVATPEEGVALRQAGITVPILVLGTFFPGQEQAFREYSLTATIGTQEAAAVLCHLADIGADFPVHLKIETGMGRLGLLEPQVTSVARELLAHKVDVNGLYTHLATADEADLQFTQMQLARFQRVRATLAALGMRPQWQHAANSAAIFRLPLDDFNLVRTGITMYGLYPSANVPQQVPLKSAISLHARAVAVRRLPAGSHISYGSTFQTTRATNIVTLPLGYADGYSRRLSNIFSALLGGKRYPLVGNITMDQCMVDVGDYPAQVGEEAVLLGAQGGEEITAEELAEALGTINYEVICMIGGRVPRVFVGATAQR